MSRGTVADFTADSLMPQTGDPVELLALGPFAAVAPGDSVTVEFAWVGGADQAAILSNAVTAQYFRDHGYQLGALSVNESERRASLRLEAVRPNPSRGGAVRVAFRLPAAGAVTVSLHDVMGREVWERTWEGLSAGPHELGVEPVRRLPPGVYSVRVAQAGATANRRVVVLE